MMKEAYAQSIGCEEPCEGRLSRTVLWEGEGETPSLYSTLSYILAIQMAGGSRGRNGFQKQKAGEKLAETEEDLLEHRMDGADAYDTLYIGCEKFPQHDVFAFDAGV